MKRKVIQLAGRTLVVSLPSKWARKYNIQKGDTINLQEQGHSLVVSSEKEAIDKKTSLNIIGLDPMVKRALGAVYKAGYDEVEVLYESKELEVAQEVIREEFIGFEVIYTGKKRLVVKKISSINPEEFDNILKRMFMILLQMADESLEAIEKQDTDWLRTIIFMDKDVDKYADFCRRVLNKYGHTFSNLSAPMYYIIEQLEKIGDSYRDICKLAINSKLSNTKEIFQEVNEFFRNFYEIYYKFDLSKVAKFGKKRYRLVEDIYSMKADLKIVLLLYTILDNTFDMNGALMAINV